jgi:putative DNA primase/helicase
VQNWLAAGKPSFKGRPLGSFEAWSRIMGGILQAAGIAGFLGNQNEFYESADEDTLAARCFVQVWWERYQNRPVLAADLVPSGEGVRVAVGTGGRHWFGSKAWQVARQERRSRV